MTMANYISKIPQELYRLPNDGARALWCKKKSTECRNLYFQGQAEMTERVMTGRRWRNYDYEAKQAIARTLWSSSQLAKQIIGDEQMFCRWSSMYAGTARL